MENLEIYNKLKTPPENALKTIQAGRLKGYSDINPQWRIEIMTEIFGICGIGWKFNITNQWLENASDSQVFAFVNIDLYIKHNGEWSDAIPGTGGTLLITKESKGLYSDDEAYKKSLTDALGNAMRFIGVGSDVYRGWFNERTKYIDDENDPTQPQPRSQPINRELTKSEVDNHWNGKIYGKYVYIEDSKIYPTQEQLKKLKSHPKFKPDDKK